MSIRGCYNRCPFEVDLGDPVWAARMMPEDYRGLSPLGSSHVNPHGRFEIILTERTDFGRRAIT